MRSEPSAADVERIVAIKFDVRADERRLARGNLKVFEEIWSRLRTDPG
jgi:hypothetical protein